MCKACAAAHPSPITENSDADAEDADEPAMDASNGAFLAAPVTADDVDGFARGTLLAAGASQDGAAMVVVEDAGAVTIALDASSEHTGGQDAGGASSQVAGAADSADSDPPSAESDPPSADSGATSSTDAGTQDEGKDCEDACTEHEGSGDASKLPDTEGAQ